MAAGTGRPQRSARNGTSLSILWLIDLQPAFELQQGASLRWFNLSRELVARGHRVRISVNQDDPEKVEPKRAFVERAQALGWASASMETSYRFSPLRSRAAHLLGHPALTNLALGSFQDATCDAVDRAITQDKVDVVVISERRLFFLAARFKNRVPVVIDWMDSLVLFEWRNIRARFRLGAVTRIPQAVKRLIQAVLQERYYGRLAASNVVVSPIDLRTLNAVTGRPQRGRLLLNGVAPFIRAARIQRAREDLLFTGVMDAPNNYEGAMWFIDRVLPLIAKARPDARFVVAGRDPHPEILKRASANVVVRGSVPDIHEEILKSGLYVAPLISGGGFRNKVVEALSTGTFVVGTSLAFEFLPSAFQEQLLVGDSASAFAERVLTFLRDPGKFEARLPPLVEVLSREYSWSRRTDEFLQIIEEGMSG